MWHDALGTIIGQGQHRAAIIHHRGSAARNVGEGIDRNIHRPREIIAACIDIAAFQFFLVGIGNGVKHKIQTAPFFFQHIKSGIHAGLVGDIAWYDKIAANRGCKRLNPLLQSLTLKGKRKLGALFSKFGSNAPRD